MLAASEGSGARRIQTLDLRELPFIAGTAILGFAGAFVEDSPDQNGGMVEVSPDHLVDAVGALTVKIGVAHLFFT